MISIDNWATQAHEKLDKEYKAVSGQKEKAMVGAVLSALKEFCGQEAEFAQAVVQGGSLAECMRKIAAGVGASISDLEVYKKAVQFYFPGAAVNMQLTIDLVGTVGETGEPVSTSDELPAIEAESVPEKPTLLTLDLSSFF